MSTPPSKRLHASEGPVASPGPSADVGSSDVPPAADSDPAGRLLGLLRDREARAAESAADPDARTPSASSLPVGFPPGTKVRVLRGPFVGKSGVVQELDGRGGARVMLGLLSQRIDLKDLETATDGAAGRERLTLSSSHRKPR